MIHGRIYLIINRVNLKKYVGQTRMSITERWRVHKQVARNGKTYAISNAIRKYGEDGFVLLEIDQAKTLGELNQLETFYIQFFNTLSPVGYNLDSGGRYYLTHPNTKAKIAAANRGRVASPETRAKLSAARKGNKNALGGKGRTGQRNTPETNAKLSAFRKGKPGVPHTEEFKRRLSKRNRGNTYSTGIPKTAEHRAKIGAGRRRFNERIKQERLSV